MPDSCNKVTDFHLELHVDAGVGVDVLKAVSATINVCIIFAHANKAIKFIELHALAINFNLGALVELFLFIFDFVSFAIVYLH